MTKSKNDEETAVEQNELQDGNRSLIERVSPYFDGIVAITALMAVLLTSIALYQTARFNNQSLDIQSSMATQEKSAQETDVYQSENALRVQEQEFNSVQTSVALQDKEVLLRETELAGQPIITVSAIPEQATATPENLPFEIAEAEVESAIFEYYILINNGSFAEAWSRLTPRFQLAFSSGNFASYKGFWESIDSVSVLEAVSQQIDRSLLDASLIVTLRFFQSDFNWDRAYEYNLVRETIDSIWKIDMTRLISE